jgi:hypothetical protein
MTNLMASIDPNTGERWADVPLHDAPERFFDPKEWGEFLELVGGREAAARKISIPDPGILVHYHDLVAAKPTLEGAEARRRQL